MTDLRTECSLLTTADANERQLVVHGGSLVCLPLVMAHAAFQCVTFRVWSLGLILDTSSAPPTPTSLSVPTTSFLCSRPIHAVSSWRTFSPPDSSILASLQGARFDLRQYPLRTLQQHQSAPFSSPSQLLFGLSGTSLLVHGSSCGQLCPSLFTHASKASQYPWGWIWKIPTLDLPLDGRLPTITCSCLLVPFGDVLALPASLVVTLPTSRPSLVSLRVSSSRHSLVIAQGSADSFWDLVNIPVLVVMPCQA
ncbi:hypothetical protein BC830DRAFT_624338 [Chytriomyces sp. MP71]|nr:hypothetical protein BC830DRAFT_624338 [Chytriomyces sp. MP71]